MGTSVAAAAGASGGRETHVDDKRTVDPIAYSTEAEKVPEDIEKTQEYKDFRL